MVCDDSRSSLNDVAPCLKTLNETHDSILVNADIFLDLYFSSQFTPRLVPNPMSHELLETIPFLDLDL